MSLISADPLEEIGKERKAKRDRADRDEEDRRSVVHLHHCMESAGIPILASVVCALTLACSSAVACISKTRLNKT